MSFNVLLVVFLFLTVLLAVYCGIKGYQMGVLHAFAYFNSDYLKQAAYKKLQTPHITEEDEDIITAILDKYCEKK